MENNLFDFNVFSLFMKIHVFIYTIFFVLFFSIIESIGLSELKLTEHNKKKERIENKRKE